MAHTHTYLIVGSQAGGRLPEVFPPPETEISDIGKPGGFTTQSCHHS